MAIGTVKWFNAAKGFGFIMPKEGGRDVFVHVTAVHASRLAQLEEGQAVEYDLVVERGREAAANLRLA